MTWYTFSHGMGVQHRKDSIELRKGDQAPACASNEIMFKGFAKISTGLV